MGAYNNLDQAIPGLIAEGIQCNSSIRSRSAKQDIQFGKPVMGYLGDAVSAYNYALDTSKLVFDADFVASNTIDITVNGEAITQVTFTTDHDTTAGLVRDAIAALTITDSVLGSVGVDCILDPTDANNRTFYIRAKGLDVTVTEDVQAGGSQATGTITYQTDQVFLGVSVFINKDVASSNVAKYFQNQLIGIMEKGIIWAYINGTINADDDAYLDNAGSDKGNFSATAGDTIGCKFRSNNYSNSTTSDTLAMLEVRGIYKPNAEIAWS